MHLMYPDLKLTVPKRKGCFLPNRSFAQRFLFMTIECSQSVHSIVYSPEGFAEHASSCFLYVEIQPVISFIISRIEGIALVWRLFPIASI